MKQEDTAREDTAIRLVSIASRFCLRQGYKPSCRELASEFGCHLRTIQRDMVTLSLVLPLTREYGRYRMMQLQ